MQSDQKQTPEHQTAIKMKTMGKVGKVTVKPGYKDSIQVKLDNEKEICLYAKATLTKFGPRFTLAQNYEINFFNELSNEVEKECKKLYPDHDYSDFSIMNGDKIRIKISPYQEVSYDRFDGFQKGYEHQIFCSGALKISQYQNKLFFKLVLVTAKEIDVKKVEPYQRQLPDFEEIFKHQNKMKQEDVLEFLDASDDDDVEITFE